MTDANPPPPSAANTNSPTANSRPSTPVLSAQEIEQKLADAAKAARANDARTIVRPVPTAEYAAAVSPGTCQVLLGEALAETPEEAQARVAREHAARVERLVRAACIPRRYEAARLDDLARVPEEDREKVQLAAWKLETSVLAGSVVGLCGPRGPGKTHMACALVRAWCEAGKSARYTTAMDIFLAIKSQYGRPGGDESVAEKQFLEPALLVIDEVQVRGETSWEDVRLTHLIDKRYADLKATLLITNLTRAKLKDSVGDSITDRFFDGGGVIECAWPSLRGRLIEA